MQTKILYEDNYIMVVHKPAGIAVQAGRVGQADVESELKNYLAVKGGGQAVSGKGPYLGIVHRLDQPVEGLLVFAKGCRRAKQPACGRQFLQRLSGGGLWETGAEKTGAYGLYQKRGRDGESLSAVCGRRHGAFGTSQNRKAGDTQKSSIKL